VIPHSLASITLTVSNKLREFFLAKLTLRVHTSAHSAGVASQHVCAVVVSALQVFIQRPSDRLATNRLQL